jgi:hypothetical protein
LAEVAVLAPVLVQVAVVLVVSVWAQLLVVMVLE